MWVRRRLATRGLLLLIAATVSPPPIAICCCSPVLTLDWMLMAVEAKPDPLDIKLSRVEIHGQGG
jgi:hypothetical protein